MAAAGSYRWAMPEDLHRLKDDYGQPFNYRDLRAMALAAEARVAESRSTRTSSMVACKSGSGPCVHATSCKRPPT